MARRYALLGYVLMVVYLSPGCHGDCNMSDNPTVKDVRDFIQCMNRQIDSMERSVTTQATKRADDGFDNFLFSLRFDEMEDFPYCIGMYPEQCFTLLRFLDKLLETQVLEQMESFSVRRRRSYNTDSLHQLLMNVQPGSFDPETRKNLQDNMQWAMERGRGTTQSRWGRSVPDTMENYPTRVPGARNTNSPKITDGSPKTQTSNGASLETTGTSGGHEASLRRRKRQIPIGLDKLQMSPELQDILAKFKTWRIKHGFGKGQGRWG